VPVAVNYCMHGAYLYELGKKYKQRTYVLIVAHVFWCAASNSWSQRNKFAVNKLLSLQLGSVKEEMN